MKAAKSGVWKSSVVWTGLERQRAETRDFHWDPRHCLLIKEAWIVMRTSYSWVRNDGDLQFAERYWIAPKPPSARPIISILLSLEVIFPRTSSKT